MTIATSPPGAPEVLSAERLLEKPAPDVPVSPAENNDNACDKWYSVGLMLLSMGTAFAAFVALSCLPLLLLLAPIIFLSLPVLTAVGAGVVFLARLRTPVVNLVLRFFHTWAIFLLPFHTVYAVAVMSIFSFAWGIALGVVLYITPMWLPFDDRPRCLPIKRWNRAVRFCAGVWKSLFHYFPITVKGLEPLDPEKKYIFGYHPHGVYAFGLFSLVFPPESGWDKVFPSATPTVVGVANSILRVPVIGSLFYRFGFVSASKACLSLACQSPYNVALIPGGIAEMMCKNSDSTETIYLNDRKGFIKLALQHGRTLVPIYAFGENRTFVRYSSFAKLREYLSRKYRIAMTLYRGRWFSPLMPLSVPIAIVAGRPIDCETVENPSDELVNKYHQMYVNGVKELFESSKTSIPGYENTELRIV